MSITTVTRPVGGSLSAMSMDELSSWVLCLSRITPGMHFAQKRDLTEKERARQAILSLFSKRAWPKGLSILTMPGLSWGFERALLLMRERRARALGDHEKRPERTYIAAIEREEAIYRMGILHMPGARESIVRLVSEKGYPPAVRTYAIVRYFRIAFEDYAGAPWTKPHDAAWLDFNGPITTQRLSKIADFWRDGLRWRLVLTWLNARQDREASALIAEAGGYFDWIEQTLGAVKPVRVLHRISYNDSNPMLQLAVEAA